MAIAARSTLSSLSLPNNNNNTIKKTQFTNPNNNLRFPLRLLSLSLSCSLVMRSRAKYPNVELEVEEDEDDEVLAYKFRKACLNAGVIQEARRRRFFENSQEKRKRKSRDAAKRYSNYFRPRHYQEPKEENPETTKKIEPYDSDDDNWDLPEGDLP